jgi:hypothetical protein
LASHSSHLLHWMAWLLERECNNQRLTRC